MSLHAEVEPAVLPQRGETVRDLWRTQQLPRRFESTVLAHHLDEPRRRVAELALRGLVDEDHRGVELGVTRHRSHTLRTRTPR